MNSVASLKCLKKYIRRRIRIVYMLSLIQAVIRKLFYPIGYVLHKTTNFLYSDYDFYFQSSPSRPFSYVQRVVENEFEDYINKKNLYSIFIVGAYKGEEVPILMSKRRTKVVMFEPVREYVSNLKSKFGNNKNIFINNCAVGDTKGSVTFYELADVGNGSALKPKPSKNSKLTKSYEVSQITLDSLNVQNEIDLLWVDVQGYEMNVLKGAKNVLKRTQSVFIEVQHGESRYEGGATFDEVDNFLRKNGFKLVLLGLSSFNMEGNAYYVKK